VAHDERKQDLLEWAAHNAEILNEHENLLIILYLLNLNKRIW
jgi:methylglyoxal synthase